MKVKYKVKKTVENIQNVSGGCWAECCTIHYNTASNGSW